MDGGFDAIVLAGGAARRLGGADKPSVVIGGRTLLEHVLDAVAGAATTVVVGPSRPTGRRDVLRCREDPPGGGPVAALAAGLARTTAEVVVVLAADLPGIAPAVPVLLEALRGSPDAGAARLVDGGGRVNHLAAAWRRAALVDALAAVGDPRGASMRALGAATRTVAVADPAGWGRDCDTWADVTAARAGHDAQAASRSSPA